MKAAVASATALARERVDAATRYRGKAMPDATRRAIQDTSNSSETVDQCVGSAQACGIQGGTLQIQWTLYPQPQNPRTIVNWQDTKFPSSVATTSFNPTQQQEVAVCTPAQLQASGSIPGSLCNNGPYTSVETINVTVTAVAALNYTETVDQTCDQNAVCNPATWTLGVLCNNQITGNCPHVQIQDVENNNTPIADPTPIGTPTTTPGLENKLLAVIKPGSSGGTYQNNVSFAWLLPAGTAGNGGPIEAQDFHLGDDQGYVQPLDEDQLGTKQVDFYWNSGVSSAQFSTVAGAIRDDNQEYSLIAANNSFTIEQPTFDLAITTPVMTV